MSTEQSFGADLLGGIFGIAIWACALSTCSKAEPKVDSGRFLPHATTSEQCAYMFSDGSIAKYDRHGECPARMIDELEAE